MSYPTQAGSEMQRSSWVDAPKVTWPTANSIQLSTEHPELGTALPGGKTGHRRDGGELVINLPKLRVWVGWRAGQDQHERVHTSGDKGKTWGGKELAVAMGATQQEQGCQAVGYGT